MSSLGTPLSPSATRLLMLGAGELGKEVVIEAQRLGVEVIAADRYPNAPAMQVAHRSHVLDMLDPQALRQLVLRERPAFIVPEIEAIATPALVELEREGFRVIPTARAARLTMDREGIRRLAAEDLGLATSPYRFASDDVEYRVLRLADGVSFVHLSTADTADGSNPLPELTSFKEFSRDLAARVATPPTPTAADLVGTYQPPAPVSSR